jgi:hypothetical protein
MTTYVETAATCDQRSDRPTTARWGAKRGLRRVRAPRAREALPRRLPERATEARWRSAAA